MVGPISLALKGMIPTEELEDATHAISNVENMVRSAEDLGYAIEMYQYHEARSGIPTGSFTGQMSQNDMIKHRVWASTAAAHGALMIYGQYQTSQDFRTLLKRAPSFARLVDGAKLKKGATIFSKGFPGFAKLRKPVAHPYEFEGLPEKLAQNTATHPLGFRLFSPGSIIGLREGPMFTATVDGEVHQYLVAKPSFDTAMESATAYVEALPPELRPRFD